MDLFASVKLGGFIILIREGERNKNMFIDYEGETVPVVGTVNSESGEIKISEEFKDKGYIENVED